MLALHALQQHSTTKPDTEKIVLALTTFLEKLGEN